MEAGLPLIIASVLIIVTTLAWMTIHAVGAVRYFRSKANEEDPHPLALVGWVVAAASGFLGPCVLLGQLVALVLALIALSKMKAGDAGPGTRIPARTVILAAAVFFLGFGIALPLILMSTGAAP